jgi:phosphoenolpyruvate-protein phosphotransferase
MISLLAPLSGVIVPLDQVPDPVFAERTVGDGIAIDPTSQTLLAPCDGRVIQVHRAGHAVTIEASGLEILMHIGLDTVALKGQGFTPKVTAGAVVKAGDPLIAFDADFIATHARSLLTEVIVTSMDRVASVQPRTGSVTAGRDVLISIALRGDAPAAAVESGTAVVSAPVIVGVPTGLHARPAALIAARARQFTSDIRIVKNEQEANARSVVSIMALDVAGGDTVRVSARGYDAAQAATALSEMLATSLNESDTGATPAAASLGAPASVSAPGPSADGHLRGVPASPGIAIGAAFQLRQNEVVVEERAADPNHERRSLDAALASAHVQLEALQARMAGDTERAAIFAAHQELLEDPEVVDAATERIRNGASAAFAWQQAYLKQADRLFGLRNPVLAGRAADLKDVGRRVLHLLIGHEAKSVDLPPDAVLIAEDLAPSETASLDRSRVRGFCTTMGSSTSHVAILARALAIPAVAGIDPRALDVASGARVVLDGDAGILQLDPSAQDERRVSERQAAAESRRSADLASAAAPAITTDGHRVEVVANIGAEDEARRVPEVGGEGVGLLRTEFLFMDRRTPPDENEQARTYEAMAMALGPSRILVIRTLDVGGDKPLPYLPIGPEPNPFLGERGIRLMHTRPEIFRAQVRAILRASFKGKIAIMFPMIATRAEWREARAAVEQERASIGAPPVQIGIMVETAAAALMADRFAEEADFFSIGTNDLTQYTLAMDRSNPKLAPQVDALHPSVLRLIDLTVTGAHAHQRWVGVCGALAGDPQAVPILIGLGVDELSVSVPAVPAVKAQIRTLSYDACRAAANAALNAGDADEVRQLSSNSQPRA